MDYFEHGNIEVKKCEDIVIVKFIGSINLETFTLYIDSLLEIAKQFKGSKWAQVNDLRHWDLSPPEVEKAALLAEKNPEKIKYRCSDIVVIADKIMTTKQAERQSTDKVFLKQHVVKSTKEAIELLKSLGYKTN